MPRPRVTVIPPVMREQYRDEMGESWFCAWAQLGTPWEHWGLAEIWLDSTPICRECANNIVDLLQSASALVEAGEVGGWLA